jgi:hypothetical protein
MRRKNRGETKLEHMRRSNAETDAYCRGETLNDGSRPRGPGIFCKGGDTKGKPTMMKVPGIAEPSQKKAKVPARKAA